MRYWFVWVLTFYLRSGFRVITTCSPKSNDLVKERGADEVYDYHDFDKCVEDIRASVGDDLQYAYCCIGGEEPAMVCTTNKNATSFSTDQAYPLRSATKSSPAVAGLL